MIAAGAAAFQRRAGYFSAPLFLLVAALAAPTITIQRDGASYRVAGWKAVEPANGWASIFRVYAGDGDVPAALGAYRVENGELLFQPRYLVNVRTRAVFHPPSGPAVEAVFEGPRLDTTSTTRVERVYPSTDLIPENQLKFYLVFSAPMSRGEAWRRIRLLNEQASVVELPFLEIDQELWDRENRRLTVLFDPGRIKRGLLPLKEEGPAIEDGQAYTLVIDREWRDARGAPLVEPFRKAFRVGPTDRTVPDPKSWRVIPPEKGGLALDFPESMDWALMLRVIDVRGADGPIAGTVEIDREETRWRFTPHIPWKPGDYQVVIDDTLEDLAGNRVGRPFDRELDRFDRVDRTVTSKTIALPFRVGH